MRIMGEIGHTIDYSIERDGRRETASSLAATGEIVRPSRGNPQLG